MIELFEHPSLVDGLLVFVALEAVVLYAWHRRTGGGLGPRTILSVLLPNLVRSLRERWNRRRYARAVRPVDERKGGQPAQSV